MEPFDDDEIVPHAEIDEQIPAQEDMNLPGPLPVEGGIPIRPSDDEVDLDNLRGHTEYAACWEHCVVSAGREDPHRRTAEVHDSDVAHVQTDYCFFSDTLKKCEEGDPKRSITVLTARDETSGCPFATVCVCKGAGDHHASSAMARWLDHLGHKRVIVTSDSEHSIKALVKAVKRRASCDLVPRAVPRGSHASLGAGEQVHQVVGNALRAGKSFLEAKLDSKVKLVSAIVPCLVRHAPTSDSTSTATNTPPTTDSPVVSTRARFALLESQCWESSRG